MLVLGMICNFNFIIRGLCVHMDLISCCHLHPKVVFQSGLWGMWSLFGELPPNFTQISPKFLPNFPQISQNERIKLNTIGHKKPEFKKAKFLPTLYAS